VHKSEPEKIGEILECGGLTPLSPTLSLFKPEEKAAPVPQHSKGFAIF
jgi:hypothetical protein